MDRLTGVHLGFGCSMRWIDRPTTVIFPSGSQAPERVVHDATLPAPRPVIVDRIPSQNLAIFLLQIKIVKIRPTEQGALNCVTRVCLNSEYGLSC